MSGSDLPVEEEPSPGSGDFRGLYHRRGEELARWAEQGHEDPLEPDLPIVDPHHHLMDDGRARYGPEDLAGDIEASGHRVVATVFVESGTRYRADGPEPLRPVGEVAYAAEVAGAAAAGRYGGVRLCAGIVGHGDLTLGDGVRPVLEELVAAGAGRLRGIRHSVCWDETNVMRFGRRQPPRHQLLDPAFRAGFAHLAPLGLSFDAWQFHPQLPELADLVRAFPGTSVILDHVGGLFRLPPHDADPEATFDEWARHVRELARYPNVTVKVGGLAMLFGNWGFHLRDRPPSSSELASTWRPYVETTIEAFGVDRCMLESNFPVDKQSSDYGALWNAMKLLTAGCSAAEKSALFHDNAARVYALDL